MAATAPPLIPADVRSRLRGLRLLPQRASGSRGIGMHASRSRGAGLEFAQYRAYEPGDELRQIDWKLYARSDRFFVRESERESPLTVWLLLDTTASMAQADQARRDWTRLQAASALAACVAELALQQGDAFGLAAIGGDGVQLVPAGHGLRQRDRLHLQLHALRAQGQWPAQERLAPVWERIAGNDLVVMIGDGFDEAAIALAERLAKAGRDVVHLQLLTAEERDFPFRDGHRFRDPETGEELLSDGATVRAGYLARFAEARRTLDARLQAAGIRHETGFLDEAIDAPLQRLSARHGGRGA
ncbi:MULTISPECIES: DUF58 domain-containing protein [Stenotrophomonas]|uniref:von Willebrand factor A n=1 Tax=Stenotrophomonas nitritireducens TaxID=83617 RepID=A0ABR5NKX0_9GAMM|nr:MULTISPECIES: DUF58 domain-containing protein [Stenotrophomonas]KQN95521.1 hypothetical protein ASF01_16340 [Stenotrophomonas sp. Leaf70]KRG58500.1 von Willebrand factor A [Stenotrophomonas nitritireducens]MBN8793747.1 DUF58 domain-containing protein [Stenotrophomonas nitritireducens]MBN8796186.1 DUF58 domain-containing protein [Stenotrophomonas nitritireducens]